MYSLKKIAVLLILVVISKGALAQTQYQNKVVVIPLWSDGSTWAGPWATDTQYNRSDIVEFDGSSYIAIISHVSALADTPPNSNWQLVADSGATGPQGEKGDVGDTGPAGPVGPAGPIGPKGDPGDIGPAGPKGDTGDTGVAGPVGPKGDPGDTGPAGAKGDTGDTGVAGPVGPKGDPGDTGPAGAKGDTGDTGPQGPMGLAGATGAAGPKGDTGDTGATGPAGADGADGADGPTYTATAPIVLTGADSTVITFAPGSIPGGSISESKLIRTSISPPSMVIRCIVYTQGIYPSRTGADEYLGDIGWVGFNFAPRGSADCSGQLVAISSNEALFSLYGTIYGGDGRTTFALPDMRGRSPVHVGSGPGLTPRQMGQKYGREFIGQ